MPDQAVADLDATMEEAGAALAQMDYLTCEKLCLQALAAAREQKNWAAYGRILMPLQETRRQRRMIAAEGTIRLGTTSLDGSPEQWLEQCETGAILVTHPHDANVAAKLAALAQERRQYVEVLFADNLAKTDASDARWTLRSFNGPETTCEIDAPPREWIDAWLSAENISATATPAEPSALSTGINPGTWLIDATEQLGDAALMNVADRTPDESLIQTLEESLQVVADHELLHQKLSSVVKQVRLQPR